jgi:hypothetical protein
VKSASASFILAVLTAFIATAAIAQTATQTPAQPPPNYAPPAPSPSQTAPAQNPTNPRSADTQGDPNDCASQLKASNPRLSAVEVKQYCQRQLNPSAPQD